MSSPPLPRRFWAYLTTESLDAFNGNVFKMLLQLFVLQFLKAPNAESIIAQSSLVFTVPFVLFGPWSGYLADRYSKSSIMKAVKFGEIPIMLLGVAGFYFASVPLLMAALFFLATQITFFSPAKAGFIPETCAPESITRANGLVSMTTFVAIIGGMAVAGQLFGAHEAHPAEAAWYGVGFAVLGAVSALLIPKTPVKGSLERFPWNPLKGIWDDLVFLKRKKALFLAALAHSYFWLLGLIFTTNILVYGKKLLLLGEHQNTQLSLLPAFMGIGIAAGSLLAGRWSGRKVELGLVPLGGLGLAAAGFGLFLSSGSYVATSAILFVSGIFGGLFIVPLYSFLQFESDEREKGRVLATVGIMNGLFLVLGSLLYRVFSVTFAWRPDTICLAMGAVSLAVVFYICTVIPEYFVRFLSWLLTHTIYNIKIVGADHVPLQGPALLTPNHISYVDAVIVGATIQRFVKFVMFKKLYDLPVLKWICRIMEVIPIAPYEGRESVVQSLDAARAKLAQGEVVCIFPEGKITRDGAINEFRTGVETVMQGIACPIVPVYLHNVWGSVFSFEGGKVFWKFPKKIPYPVTVVYGEPLPASTPAAEVEAAVKRLAAEFGGAHP